MTTFCPRVRAPESWNLPVGLSLSAEVGYQQRQFSTDTWTLELRPIIDKQWGPWYASVNPVFDMSIKGQNSGQGFGFSLSAKVSYSVTPKVALGLEYYASLGPVKHLDRWSDQQQQIFLVIDVDLGPRWEFNFGVGFGMTSSTDRLIVKMILGYRFDWGEASAARAMIRAHLLRWRPRPHAQRSRKCTPRARPSGAASQLDPSHRSSWVSPTGR